jgi:hypothetical protein
VRGLDRLHQQELVEHAETHVIALRAGRPQYPDAGGRGALLGRVEQRGLTDARLAGQQQGLALSRPVRQQPLDDGQLLVPADQLPRLVRPGQPPEARGAGGRISATSR